MAFTTSQVGAVIHTWLGAAGELAVCREPGHGEICLAPLGEILLNPWKIRKALRDFAGFGGETLNSVCERDF